MTTETTQPNPAPFTAADKARLIGEALATLRGAHAIDERETLDPGAWVAWYDATLPNVRDIKTLAHAMDIELSLRRGQRVAEEGERRGGDQRSKLTPGVSLKPSEWKRRSEDHTLHKARPLVENYRQQEIEAGRTPTRKAALRVARPRPDAPAASRKATQFHVGQLKAQQRAGGILAALTAVADGTHYTDAALRRAIRHHATLEVAEFLKSVRLIPWLAITRDDRGTTFTIDEDLRDICDGRRPRPTLVEGGQSLADFLHHLRAEIRRRRKENHDEFRKRKWNSELIHKGEQTAILDWIEEQLDRLPE
jgi:hypothetical protein